MFARKKVNTVAANANFFTIIILHVRLAKFGVNLPHDQAMIWVKRLDFGILVRRSLLVFGQE